MSCPTTEADPRLFLGGGAPLRNDHNLILQFLFVFFFFCQNTTYSRKPQVIISAPASILKEENLNKESKMFYYYC